ncbi:uncharacterized protein LOC126372621 isoform X2 [Pectinophora gossypiella]|nr:uncharacterized protein LOC126372621 isoform X2 [Pectinophora gossypiella]
MIYTGEHTVTKNLVTEKIGKSVNYVNSGYCDIPVNGVLLVYDSYFVHAIEGSEDSVFRQLRFLYNIEKHWIEKMNKVDEEEEAAAAAAAAAEGLTILKDEEQAPKEERVMFRRLKLLMVYHSITKLKFSDWRAHYARPASLVGKLDLYGPVSEHMEQLRVCLDKIAKLIKLSTEIENLSFEGLSANDPHMEALPEVALLDFLLQSPFTIELHEVSSFHRRVDDYVFYFEQVWPLPTAFTPRHLYKLKIDDSFVEPLPVMPWEIQEADEEKEGEGQDKGSSSSD